MKTQITANLERSSQALDERLRKTLVDQQLAAAEIEKAAREARARLQKSNDEIDRLAKVPERYSEVARRVDGIQGEIETHIRRTERQLKLAQAQTEAAVRSVNLLKRAAVDTASGNPAVLSTTFSDRGGFVEGTNFGDIKGRLLQYIYPTTPDGVVSPTKTWEVPLSNITSWTNRRIEYTGMFGAPTADSPHMGFTVETADGRRTTR